MITKTLKEWRKMTGKTQAQIAEAAGVTRQTIINFEKRAPKAVKIIEAYGLRIAPDLDQLIGKGAAND